jgi:hypothetical protein
MRPWSHGRADCLDECVSAHSRDRPFLAPRHLRQQLLCSHTCILRPKCPTSISWSLEAFCVAILRHPPVCVLRHLIIESSSVHIHMQLRSNCVPENADLLQNHSSSHAYKGKRRRKVDYPEQRPEDLVHPREWLWTIESVALNVSDHLKVFSSYLPHG